MSMAYRFGVASIAIAGALCGVGIATPSYAAGDLLVAPTRVVFVGTRGTEVLLNNIGSEPATYRISLELKRMMPDGSTVEIAPEAANATEAAALSLFSYAPRRIELPPNQPQAIRVGVRVPEGLPDGEYRAHMLFRAIPAPKVATEPPSQSEGLSISITPIYGVTIPIIFRKGNLVASAALSAASVIDTVDGKALRFTLTRSGNRSTYGKLRVTKPGQSTPVAEFRGLAAYPEITARTVTLPLDPASAAALKGPVTIEYLEDLDAGGAVIASFKTILG